MIFDYKDFSHDSKEVGEYFWFTTAPGNPLCKILEVKELPNVFGGQAMYTYKLKKVNFLHKWFVLNIIGTFDSRQSGIMVYMRN